MLREVNASLYSENRKSKLNILLNVIIAVIAVVLVAEIMFAINYSGIYVVGSSMYPTLNGAESEDSPGGDYVYVNKHSKPDYGDIVVVFRNSDTTIIKRAVAFGGDYVRIDRGQLQIKYSGTDEFVDVEENYVASENNTPDLPKNNFHNDENGYYVEEGYFFLLGDNRDVSEDSRSRGSFKMTNLYGVVVNWSMKNKSFISSVHEYFYFDIPRFFGLR